MLREGGRGHGGEERRLCSHAGILTRTSILFRANGALMSRHTGGKASPLYLALKACAQSKNTNLRMEAHWAEGILLKSFTEDAVGG